MQVERDIEPEIFKWLEEREIIAIIGPRQGGKTTLLHKIAERVVEMGLYEESRVHLRSLDDELERVRFEGDPVGYATGLCPGGQRHLLLLDEVQYVADAGTRLKVIFDRLGDNVKLVITGSSGLDLRNIGGSLVGRAVFFELYPFSFGEFLRARDGGLYGLYRENRFDPDAATAAGWDPPLLPVGMGRLLEEYVTWGGFPRIALMDDPEKKGTLLRHMITLYIEKDILKVYGGSYRNDALRVIQYLAHQPGGMLNHEDISSDLGLDVRKVNETVDVLEDSFILRRVRPFFGSLSTELRKRPKVYFLDNGIRNVLAGDLTFSRQKGFLLEGAVLSGLIRRDPKLRYWRTTAKAEVDFVVDGKIPVEVKSTPRITRAFRSFISTYHPPVGIVVNYSVADVLDVDGTMVYFVPAALL